MSEEKWIVEISKIRPIRLNEQPDVINVLCRTFNISATYITYSDKGKIVISFIGLGDKNHLLIPVHFFYSAFWVDDTLSDAKYGECVTDFLQQLQRKFVKIDIRLPVDITDVRPFLWKGFVVRNYYTYVKTLDDCTYHSSTQKNIRKAKAKGYLCKEEHLNQESLVLNLQILKDLKIYWRGGIDKIANMFKDMSKEGKVKTFNCYLDNRLIASNIVFVDCGNKIAYTVLLNKVASEIKDDIHSLLHHFFFTKLKSSGIDYVDLLGGDIQNIAAFKSRLNTTLRPHFVVSYSKNRSRINSFLSDGKMLFKKLVSRV